MDESPMAKVLEHLITLHQDFSFYCSTIDYIVVEKVMIFSIRQSVFFHLSVMADDASRLYFTGLNINYHKVQRKSITLRLSLCFYFGLLMGSCLCQACGIPESDPACECVSDLFLASRVTHRDLAESG